MLVDAGHNGEVALDLVVLTRTEAADGVVVLHLGHADGTELPEWQPGAHIDLVLADGLIRQYSLCGDNADRSRWRIGVLREPESRGGSRLVHDSLVEGSQVHVIGPRNHFPLVPSRNYIFIAGGIGITPLIPMAKAAEAAGASWTLAYGGRSRLSMAFLDELAQFGSKVSIQPFDEVGLIDLATLLERPSSDTLVFACGPEPLLAAIEFKCETWPQGSLHLERFSAKPMEDPDFKGVFEIQTARGGDIFSVGPDQSIMEVLEDAGYDILCSCREGVCGSCDTVLLSGVPEHRDSVMSDEEKARNDRIMICVSRSLRGERLVLDI